MRQKKAPIDYQLDYMERLFYKIKFKKTESYVIHRIWDKLDDARIRFEIQQPIKLPNGNTVLADLYLPQLGIFIEVNEPYHENEQQKPPPMCPNAAGRQKIQAPPQRPSHLISALRLPDVRSWK